MLTEKMIKNMKIKLGLKNNKDDDLLLLYLDDAKTYILDYCNIKKLNEKLERVAIEIAIIYYNKNGVEGQLSHSEGGISRSYTDDLPKRIVKILKSERCLH